ncbi:MAG: WXG100 family type VII secretion target [Kibdelosporangium sp.]
MAPRTSADTEGMATAVGHLTQTASDARSTLGNVSDETATLLAAWTGPAATKFSQAMTDWNGEFSTIVRRLNEMVVVMGSNAKSYVSTDEEATHKAGNWAAGLTGL